MAFDGDTVLAQPGIYLENIDFIGKNITVGSLTITTGDTSYIKQTIIDGNGSESVVTVSNGEGSAAKLRGVNIINGRNLNGGGIIVEYSAITLQDLIISQNVADSCGGGIYCMGGSIVASDVQIYNNTANGKLYGGGGIDSEYSTIDFDHVLIADNYSYWAGGGALFKSTTADLNNVTIVNNTTQNGGGVYIGDATVTVANTIIWGNKPEQVLLSGYYVPCIISVTYSNIQNGDDGIIDVNTHDNTVEWLPGNINSLPLFCDADNEGYTLAKNSPCVKSGEDGADMGAMGVDCGPISTDNIALRFDGINDFVMLSSTGVPTGSNPEISVTAWINCDSSDYFRGIIGWGTGTTPGTHFAMGIGGVNDIHNYNDNPDFIGGLRIWVSHSGESYDWNTGIDLHDGWNHVGYVFDGTNETLFLDGDSITSNPVNFVIGTVPAVNIGLWDDFAGSPFYFKGIIDEVRIWNVVRTENHLKADMYQELTGEEPGLIGYWKFNEGTNNYTFDKSISGDLGIISGAEWVVSDALITPVEILPVIINEIMYSPISVQGGNGEWFELFNPNSDWVNLTGWIIRDADNDYHIIDEPLWISPGDFMVFGIDSNKQNNGGIDVDHQYEQTYLGNSSDELIIANSNDVIVDSVCWDNGLSFPAVNGASIKLIDTELDNSIGSNWAASITPFGAGDCGTPGMPNYIPRISIDPVFSFDTVTVGETAIRELEIINTGAATLNVHSMHTIHNIFQLSSEIVTIDAQDTASLLISFTPVEIREYHDTLFITSDAYDNSLMFVELYGLGGDSVVSVGNEVIVPVEFTMHQNYPNPFNPITTIQYELPERTDVRITIYDLLGKEVRILVAETQEPGIKSVRWDASKVSSGVYFYRIQAGNYVQTRKMVLLK